MSGSYRGLVLAGRYRLEERTHVNPDAEIWRSVDATLDRTVSVRLMRPGHPFAADVADAARRAALIDDIRLVRVLDVGSDGDSTFVVSEYLDGDTLASLVERSPLTPPAVRRIIGEVAQGLDVAAARGLHHLRLTPRSVRVDPDGAVKISGVAVEAAAAGLEPGHAATANRVDAVALVALLYSGLTGRWPLGDAGFPPAPRGEGGNPVPPADLVPGVPNDLDTLCAVTLGAHDDGPRTPAELVQQLAPWPSAQEAPIRAIARRPPADGATAAQNSSLTMRGRSAAARRPAKPAAAPAAPSEPVKSQPAQPVQPVRPAAPVRRSATLFPSPSVATTGSLPVPAAQPTDGPRRMDNLFTQQTVYPDNATTDATTTGSARTDNAGTDSAGTDSAGTDSRTPDGTAPGEAALDGTASNARASNGTAANGAASDHTKPIRVRPAGSTGPAPNSTGRANGRPPDQPSEPLVPWGAGWPTEPALPSRLESTGPLRIIIPTEAPPQEQSRVVIVSVIAALVLVLIVAAFTLRNFGGGDTSDTVVPVPGVARTPSATVSVAPIPGVTPTPSVIASSPPPSPSPTPTPTPSPSPPAVPAQISSALAIDPEADGDENSSISKLAIDNHPKTFWKSATYKSSAFGGLKKGVGLVLKLKRPAVISSVDIAVHGSGGAVELRTANSPTLDSSRVVAKGSISNGRATMRVAGGSPSAYVILWFTKLPSVGGVYRLEVSEVQLK